MLISHIITRQMNPSFGVAREIMQQFDLKTLRPLVVMFEYRHLPSDQMRVIFALLESNGYRMIFDGNDALEVFSGVRKP